MKAKHEQMDKNSPEGANVDRLPPPEETQPKKRVEHRSEDDVKSGGKGPKTSNDKDVRQS